MKQCLYRKRSFIDKGLILILLLTTASISNQICLNLVKYLAVIGIFSPITPSHMDWSKYYPERVNPKEKINPEVEFADIGCGYGGLLITLSPMFPDNLIIGMEIRVKVSDYVMDRIAALRSQHPDQYQNIACLRTNAMKYLPNYFKKGQVILLNAKCNFCSSSTYDFS